MKTNESFEKIANKLNTTFVETTVSAIENEIQTVENKKNEIIKSTKNTDLSLKDKDYINEEIKDLIKISKSVLKRLDQDIKIGTPPRTAEVFAILANSIVTQLKELRELNKMVMDVDVMNNPGDLTPKTNVNIKMTGSEMLELYEKMKGQSKLNKIDAEFTVEDDKKPENKRKSEEVEE